MHHTEIKNVHQNATFDNLVEKDIHLLAVLDLLKAVSGRKYFAIALRDSITWKYCCHVIVCKLIYQHFGSIIKCTQASVTFAASKIYKLTSFHNNTVLLVWLDKTTYSGADIEFLRGRVQKKMWGKKHVWISWRGALFMQYVPQPGHSLRKMVLSWDIFSMAPFAPDPVSAPI